MTETDLVKAIREELVQMNVNLHNIEEELDGIRLVLINIRDKAGSGFA